MKVDEVTTPTPFPLPGSPEYKGIYYEKYCENTRKLNELSDLALSIQFILKI